MNILVPDSSPATVAAHPIDTLRAASAVPEALAQRLAAEHYGLISAVHRLDSERDQNFRLRSVLKIRPPLVFGTEHADLLVETLDQALGELSLMAEGVKDAP
jgi:hypothetical protein